MKLVEILARELKDWPRTAAFSYSSGTLARFATIKGKTIADYMTISEEPEDHMIARVTRTEWQAAVDALKTKEVIGWWHPAAGNPHKAFAAISSRKSLMGALGHGFEGEKEDGSKYHVFTDYWSWKPVDELAAKWNGEGLPPVGAVVNIRFPEYAASSPHAVKNLHVGERSIFYADQSTGDEFAHSIKELEFSLIRTPEHIEAKELREIIESGLGGAKTLAQVVNEIQIAGYRKQESK